MRIRFLSSFALLLAMAGLATDAHTQAREYINARSATDAAAPLLAVVPAVVVVCITTTATTASSRPSYLI